MALLESFDVDGFLRCPRILPPEAPDVGFLISLLDVSCCSSVISFIRLRGSMKIFLEFYLFLSVGRCAFKVLKREIRHGGELAYQESW